MLGHQGTLDLDRGGHRVPGSLKRHEERVAVRGDLATAVTGARGANQAIVSVHYLRVAPAEPAKERCGTLDVGKQERDRPWAAPTWAMATPLKKTCQAHRRACPPTTAPSRRTRPYTSSETGFPARGSHHHDRLGLVTRGDDRVSVFTDLSSRSQ
jgi:hypothetical protein